MNHTVLFIGRVWPEPTSSAAGRRILQLVNFFTSREYQVIFSSSATKTEASFVFDSENICEKEIQLNHTSFNQFIRDLSPEIVIFDRFITEEQFGWRVREECPEAICILDTEDLHFLRYAREKAYKNNAEPDFYNDITIRELTSLLRCDLNLIISEFEMEILQNEFGISSNLLYYLPFLEDLVDFSPKSLKPYELRKDFIFIGNFLHEPNRKAVLDLKHKYWPEIRKKLPGVQLHIYGAYTDDKVKKLHAEKEGFLIHGKAKDAVEAIIQSKIMLSPLPFGAGLKGKFIDAMYAGTPIATNRIGAEGMFQKDIPGICEDDFQRFTEKTIELYQSSSQWKKSQEIGFEILIERFDKIKLEQKFEERLNTLRQNFKENRRKNWMGRILKTNQFKAAKFMSLWIEEKNQKV